MTVRGRDVLGMVGLKYEVINEGWYGAERIPPEILLRGRFRGGADAWRRKMCRDRHY